jgi:hypothetical protein
MLKDSAQNLPTTPAMPGPESPGSQTGTDEVIDHER